eukprot:scaffold1031_cov66-Skeletonema_marinoi.AAC.1
MSWMKRKGGFDSRRLRNFGREKMGCRTRIASSIARLRARSLDDMVLDGVERMSIVDGIAAVLNDG